MTVQPTLPSVPNLRQMRHDDFALLSTLDRIRPAITRPQPDRRISLGPLVDELAACLESIRIKDETLYPKLANSSDRRLRDAANKIIRRYAGLHEKFLCLQRKWSMDRVARQWSDFCSEFLAFISEVRLRVDREELILYPLLEASQLGTEAERTEE